MSSLVDGDCILVFGVSGVGKSWLCQEFTRAHPNFLYLRASDVLSDITSKAPEELRTAKADQIKANQQLLANELRLRRRGQRERPVLVDAHGVIDNDNELVRVPVESVRSMEPTGLILLEADPSVIANRRQIDSRTRPRRGTAALRREIAAERETVFEFAKLLGLPIEVGSANDGFSLDAVVTALRQRISSGRT